MTTEGKLEALIGQAGEIKPLNLLPSNSTFFQRKLAEVVTDILGDEMGSSSLGFQSACKETIDSLSPLVDYLTQSRSITEFQELKMALLKNIWGHGSKSSEVFGWLNYLLPEIRLFPYIDSFFNRTMSPEEAWQEFETVPSHPFRQRADKIISVQEAEEEARQNREENEGRNGFIMGKWRFVHYGHNGLFEPAKESLGKDGKLFVGVESQESIWRRRGPEHSVLPDAKRLEQVAALEAVDYAVLVAPDENELHDLDSYYRRIWEDINPDIVFIGSRDYHWRPTYEQRAHELGMLLLWEYPTAPFSSSELFNLIKNAG